MDELSSLRNVEYVRSGASRIFSRDGLLLAEGEKPGTSEFWFRASLGLTAGIVFLSVLLW